MPRITGAIIECLEFRRVFSGVAAPALFVGLTPATVEPAATQPLLPAPPGEVASSPSRSSDHERSDAGQHAGRSHLADGTEDSDATLPDRWADIAEDTVYATLSKPRSDLFADATRLAVAPRDIFESPAASLPREVSVDVANPPAAEPHDLPRPVGPATNSSVRSLTEAVSSVASIPRWPTYDAVPVQAGVVLRSLAAKTADSVQNIPEDLASVIVQMPARVVQIITPPALMALRGDVVPVFADSILTFTYDSVMSGSMETHALGTHARAWMLTSIIVALDGLLIGHFYAARRRTLPRAWSKSALSALAPQSHS